MFDPATLGVFLLAALALNLTPGPDILFCFANGMARGRMAGVVAALGVGAGCLVHTIAAALGLAGLLATSPLAFDIVRYAGAAYLVWLAINALRAPPAKPFDDGARLPPRDLWRLFRDGALTNILNPKIALFFLAFLPQFVDADHDPVLQVVVLGTLMNVSGTIVNVLVGGASGAIGRFLARRPFVGRVLNWFTGLVFFALAARLVLSERGMR